MVAKTICLVSPGHIGSNPRLVKEAEALVSAGYRVHVIYGETFAPALARDEAVLAKALWSSQSVSLLNSGRYRSFDRWIHRLANLLYQWGARDIRTTRLACHPLFNSLLKEVLSFRADLYIGHCLTALPIVVMAASRHDVQCGFDAEDFHSAESIEHGAGRTQNKIARTLESKYLPLCDYLTAASPLIVNEYRHHYGVRATPILNVFPLAETVEPVAKPAIPKFYWFSQTVGPGRGLEKFFDLLARMHREVQIDLRGHVTNEYKELLEKLVLRSQIELKFLSPACPDEMVALSSGYTAGLSLEESSPMNRDVCLTNKAFTYLLAGTPVILTITRAQELLAADLGRAALLIDAADQQSSASRLKEWLDDDQEQQIAREAAFELGRQRYNWDLERVKFLNVVSAQLPLR